MGLSTRKQKYSAGQLESELAKRDTKTFQKRKTPEQRSDSLLKNKRNLLLSAPFPAQICTMVTRIIMKISVLMFLRSLESLIGEEIEAGQRFST
jgi:hypothetical protein